MTTQTVSLNNLKTATATLFRDSIGDANLTSNVYLWLARSFAWDDEPTPNTPASDVATNLDARQNISYIERVDIEETSLAIPRINWTLNTVYDQYSSTDDDLFTKDFYVITSANCVYKCISNNDGAQSTDVPIGTTTNIITLSDGYQWKFMFNLSVIMADTFLSDDYIPIPQGTQKTSLHTQVENYAAQNNPGDPPGGHGKNAPKELGCGELIISKKVLLLDRPVAFEHRQFGLILNPTGTLDSNNEVVIDSNFDYYAGTMLTCTNHAVVSNTTEKSETIQIVLSF